MTESRAIRVSDQIELISQSEIRNMSTLCDAVGGINMSQGISDLPLQPEVVQGVQDAIAAGLNSYTHYSGIDPLKSEIAKKARHFNQIDCTEENIIVSSGATGAFYCAAMALLSPGDEVILFEPYYGYHVNTLCALNLNPVFARLSVPDWTIDFEQLSSVISPRTRAILICTPANPSGKVFTLSELERLGGFCEQHDLLVFTDEVYEYFTYGGREHVSPAAVSVLKNRTITISGYSKVLSITGWRLGYCIAPEEVVTAIGHVNDLVYVCAPAPLQGGVASALPRLPSLYYQKLNSKYQNIRDVFCSVLDKAGMSPYVPEGGCYVMADASALPGNDTREKAVWLLDHSGIAAVPGEAFYDSEAEDCLRFCFSKPDHDIEEACLRLGALKL